MPRYSFAYLVTHARDLLRLAVPVIVARAGMMTMALADTVFVGWYEVADLGALTIGNAAITTALMASLGLLMGTLVMSATAFGAGDFKQCGLVWGRSLPYAFLIGVGCAVIGLFAEPLLLAAGQTSVLAREGARVALVLALGAPFLLAHAACMYFLEGIKRPVPGMLIMLMANVLNIALNWVLVFGNLGAPAMGAAGSAWATTIGRAVAFITIAFYIWHMADHEKFAIRKHVSHGWWRDWRHWRAQRRLGFAQGASNTIEAGAFNAMALIAGMVGVVPLAAYGILFNLIALTFMIPLGIAAATAVRVAAAHGADDRCGVAAAGWMGLGLCVVILGAVSLIFLFFAVRVAGFYSSDPALILVTAPLIALAAWLVIADGAQVVMSSALRGLGDGWMPAGMHLVSYVVIMVPMGWLLAISMGRGALGLVEAVLVASLVSAALLTGRFYAFARRR